MRRKRGRGLALRTVAERIAPESLTRPQCGFVHRNISRCPLRIALDQVCDGPTSDGLGAESLRLQHLRSRIRSEEESSDESASTRAIPMPPPPSPTLPHKGGGSDRLSQHALMGDTYFSSLRNAFPTREDCSAPSPLVGEGGERGSRRRDVSCEPPRPRSQ